MYIFGFDRNIVHTIDQVKLVQDTVEPSVYQVMYSIYIYYLVFCIIYLRDTKLSNIILRNFLKGILKMRSF